MLPSFPFLRSDVSVIQFVFSLRAVHCFVCENYGNFYLQSIVCVLVFFLLFSGAFDLLAYTNRDQEIPETWEESQARIIANSQEVRLRSFSTSVHKVDTMVSYKGED